VYENLTLHAILFVAVLFTPALALWFFGLAFRRELKPAKIAEWRRHTFQGAFICAACALCLLGTGGIHALMDLGESRATTPWISVNRLGAFLWMVALGTALTGKGWGRLFLFGSCLLIAVAAYGAFTFIP
jgi:hypothetical protein